MSTSIVNLLAVALYLMAAALLWLRLQGAAASPRGARTLVLAVVFVALLIHGGLLYVGLVQDGLNLGLTNAFAIVAWAVVLLFWLAALGKPIETLGIVVLPIAALTVWLEWRWPSAAAPLPVASALLFVHIIVSLLAYSLLSLAVVQSLVLALQERQLHRKPAGGILRGLPPMQTMESLMFQMIGIGFLLLTLTVISGVFFSEQVFGKPLRFTHHIVLSILAWLTFATLLFGRLRFGWRGRHAVRWTLMGFSLLVLAYFGSKFVFEIVIGPR